MGPLSGEWLFLVALGLALILASLLRGPARRPGPKQTLAAIAVCCSCLVAFPLLQMCCFGKTDYRRKADVAVVLGARVYADGRLSDALADRVRTACELYRGGWVRKLLFSGGPGDGSVHETEAMKRMAVGLGVSPKDILLDGSGFALLMRYAPPLLPD